MSSLSISFTGFLVSLETLEVRLSRMQVASIPDALKPLVGCAHEMVPCLNFEPARLYKMPTDETVPSGRKLKR